MLPRNVTYALLGLAVLLSAVLLSSRFPGTLIYRELTYSLKACEETAETDLDTLAIALGRYETTNRTYPTTEQGLDALVNRPASPPIPEAWSPKLETIPLDPWNRSYVYENPGTGEGEDDEKSGRRLDLYSLGPDGITSDDDIEAEIGFVDTDGV